MVDDLLMLMNSLFFIPALLFMDFSDKARHTRKSLICYLAGLVSLTFYCINSLLSVENYYIFWALYVIAQITVIAQFIFKNKTTKKVN